jgi:hypothetical protein
MLLPWPLFLAVMVVSPRYGCVIVLTNADVMAQ